MKTSTLFFVFMTGHFSLAQPALSLSTNALIITEVFPDPSPSYGLPEKEYIELFNSGPDTLNLKNMSISDQDKSVVFPDFYLNPLSYLILCKSADVASFKPYGNVLGFSSFISLNNEGDEIFLRTASGTTISQMTYSASGYVQGRSLENSYLRTFCTTASEWEVSASELGGSPGKENTVLMSGTSPVVPAILEAAKISDSTIALVYTISLQPISLQNGTFSLDGGNIQCLPFSYFQSEKKLILKTDHPLLAGGVYTLEASGVRACLVDTLPVMKVEFLVTENADSADILVNELLFNPYPGCYDFIELYNASRKYIDLKDFHLANWQNDTISNEKRIAGKPLVISPGEYLAFTVDKNQLIQKYPRSTPAQVIEATLPSWNDDAGTAVLLLPGGGICDLFTYNENFHLSLLADKEGISLERISFKSATASKDNWHSAAAGAGFATPGTENSQMTRQEIREGWNIEPQAFSPDGDGYKDFTTIQYSLLSSQIVTLQVYDIQGRPIKKLASNMSLASQGFIQWDGSLEDATLASAGYYIVHISSFDLNGNLHEEKKPVVVTFKD